MHRGLFARPDNLALEADDLRRLAASAGRLDSLPAAEAKLECFRLGGEMIHRLAKDPLLPEPFADVAARRALWRAMVDYDRQGKEIWARANHGDLNRIPHPQLVRGAVMITDTDMNMHIEHPACCESTHVLRTRFNVGDRRFEGTYLFISDPRKTR